MASKKHTRPRVRVVFGAQRVPVMDATVVLSGDKDSEKQTSQTDQYGVAVFPGGRAVDYVNCKFGNLSHGPVPVTAGAATATIAIGSEITLVPSSLSETSLTTPSVGDTVRIDAEPTDAYPGLDISWQGVDESDKTNDRTARLVAREPGMYDVRARFTDGTASAVLSLTGNVLPRVPNPISGDLGVSLRRSEAVPTGDLGLWLRIRNTTEALSFSNYARYMETLFCGRPNAAFDSIKKHLDEVLPRRTLPFTDTDGYRVVKAATEAFVMVNCGVALEDEDASQAANDDELRLRELPSISHQNFVDGYLKDARGLRSKTLPYLAVIRAKLPDIAIKFSGFDDYGSNSSSDDCFGILQSKLSQPCLLELIWSYWHEEGMLVQSINAITRRFQNIRAAGSHDPLVNLELDPIRPLNNLMWGYVQDEQHRLSVNRRNHEYDHHYGLRLDGKAVGELNAADSRSKFLEGFHNLLKLCSQFYKQDDNTTIKADAYPILNALKEVHLLLSQGAHGQYGDLPSVARVEMLTQAFLLARPEFREVLPTRMMVAYPEPWMDRVDAMKKLQGWTDTSVLHFRNLAVFGEQILLSARFGFWTDANDPAQAFNWARFFRPQVQGYLHHYRAATGVDLTADNVTADVDATLPSVLLKRRLKLQRSA